VVFAFCWWGGFGLGGLSGQDGWSGRVVTANGMSMVWSVD